MTKVILLAIACIVALAIAVHYWKLVVFVAVIIVIFTFPVILPFMGVFIGVGLAILLVQHLLQGPQRAEERRRQKERDESENRRKEAERQQQKERGESENRRKEAERQQHRDSDQQVRPYTYKIDRHGNEALAIRYGIANQEKKIEPYTYYKKGGELARNPSRDKVYYAPASTITLQKTKRIRESQYEVLLTDYRDRKAIAVIEIGTEYVKTFLPMQDGWFKKHADLELALKGNGSFSLKELANFHIQKTIGG
nr:hypothetical protein [Thiocapsa sp. KS1]